MILACLVITRACQESATGGRKRGRQRTRWEDNVPEWIGLTMSDAVRESEERERRRKMAARSSFGAPAVVQTME